jgi:signal transduction histidine kinase
MLLSMRLWRVLGPLVAVGLVLLLISIFMVGRDLTFARSEAEGEVLAMAEASALAIQFAPAAEVEPYVSRLVKHPAIVSATVYSSNGTPTTARRPASPESPFIRRFVPSLREPVVGCRSIGSGSVCLEGDMPYFHKRLAALIVPHSVLLGASALLLVVAIILGGGGNRREIKELGRVVKSATEESNYSLRMPETKGNVGELSGAINKLFEQMQQRDLMLRRRSGELEAANKEMEAFSYSVSHDLRGPLASVAGFSEALEDIHSDNLDESGKECVRWIRDAAQQMNDLIAGLLQMSRASRGEMTRARVDLSAIAESLAASLRQRDPSRSVEFRIEPGLVVDGDERLLRAVLENLMSNAYKFTGKKTDATITVGSGEEGGRRTYFVKDNGAGFDSTQGARMFTPFQRLHTNAEFEGTGIGLSTVKRIIERHGGAIWADSQVGQGATFFFTLGDTPGAAQRTEAAALTSV